MGNVFALGDTTGTPSTLLFCVMAPVRCAAVKIDTGGAVYEDVVAVRALFGTVPNADFATLIVVI